jgi:hypothetical protein
LPYYAWDTAGADGQARRLQVTRAVDTFRLDDLVTLDLQIAKEVPTVGPFRTLVTAQVLNLTGEDAALHRELPLSGPRADLVDETVTSRTVRFGVRFSWD